MLNEEMDRDDLGRVKADFERSSSRFRCRFLPRLVVRLNRAKKYVSRSQEMALPLVLLKLDRLRQSHHLSRCTLH